MGNVIDGKEGTAIPISQHNVVIKDDFTAEDYFQEVMKNQLRVNYIKECIENKQKYVAFTFDPKDAMEIVAKLKKDSFEQYGIGCIMGNFLGDAIGAKDEFVGQCLQDAELNQTMKMPGGGSHKTAPGQGTDDSELSTSLMLGIVDQNIKSFMDGNNKVALNMDKVCIRYKDWYESDPFDCGSTVRGALGALTRHWRELSDDWELIIRESASRDIYKVSEAVNKASKSNGSLMKICPIAVWASEVLLNDSDENRKHFKDIIDADARIIHSEEMTRCCIYVYSGAIAYLINHRNEKNRAENAIKYAIDLANGPYGNAAADGGAASAAIWIQEAEKLWADCKAVDTWIFNPHIEEKKEERYKCVEAIGFIKHAFILSFYYLFKAADLDESGNLTYDLSTPAGQSFYFESVRESISLGGDTDTNACIVGGIVGAYVGIQNIDPKLLEIYFTYDNKTADFENEKGRKRPEWLNMGRHSLDSIFWLQILRYQASVQPSVEFVYNKPVVIPENVPIKN